MFWYPYACVCLNGLCGARDLLAPEGQRVSVKTAVNIVDL